jgi:diadenosine tetraphosphate (Ap4A) HIT family hydrolase
MANRCPFCDIEPGRVIASNEEAFAIRDGFPISPGHTLIITRRHIGSFFDLDLAERSAMLDLLETQKRNLDCELHPAAYNIGINDGKSAGQTVPHLHIHLIPRFEGDSDDPRGGVRWIVPQKARYWND